MTATLARRMSQGLMHELERLGRACSPEGMGTSQRRRDHLRAELKFLRDPFESLEALIDEYAVTWPLDGQGAGLRDCQGFLAWLNATQSLTPRQQDCVVCQRSWFMVEEQIQQSYTAHLRFQQQCAVGKWLIERPDREVDRQIYLNPIRIWARFTTFALLDGAAQPPANVLFFGGGDQSRAVLFELEGQALLNELVDYQPACIREWTQMTRLAYGPDLDEFCRDLARLGLVALA